MLEANVAAPHLSKLQDGHFKVYNRRLISSSGHLQHNPQRTVVAEPVLLHAG